MQRTPPRSTGENSIQNAGHLFGGEIVGELVLVASATLVPSVAADSTRFSPTTSERGVKGRLSELGSVWSGTSLLFASLGCLFSGVCKCQPIFERQVDVRWDSSTG